MSNNQSTVSTELRKLASALVVNGGELFEAGKLAVRSTGTLFKACDEIDRLRAALEHYANEKAWKSMDDQSKTVFDHPSVDKGWEPAARALGKFEV